MSHYTTNIDRQALTSFGQDPITATLKQALISNRIAPAYIFWP